MDGKNDTQYRNAIKAYTPFFLRLYDFLIIGIFTRFFWKCSAEHYIAAYQAHAGSDHADIGVGTGYFPDRAGFDARTQKITLIDLNENSLRHTARRLARFAPATHVRNACEPIVIDGRRFDSICIGGVIHCVPGPMRDKGKIFDALAPIADASTTVFGYTLLGKGVRMTWYARLLMRFLNWLRVVDNLEDTPEGLLEELRKRFSRVEVRLVGCNAFFVAQK